MELSTDRGSIEESLVDLGLDGDKLTPEYVKWLHVRILEDAVEILKQKGNPAGKADALSWLISDSDAEFSFFAVAEYMEIEPSILRKKILDMPAVKAAVVLVREWLDTEQGKLEEFRLMAEKAHQERLCAMAKAGTLTEKLVNARVRTHNPKADHAPAVNMEDMETEDQQIQTLAAEAIGVLEPFVSKIESLVDRYEAESDDPELNEARAAAIDHALLRYNFAGQKIWEKLVAIKGERWAAMHLWCPYADFDPCEPRELLPGLHQTIEDLRELAAGPPKNQAP